MKKTTWIATPLIVIGVILLAVGFVYPFVTVKAGDAEPPRMLPNVQPGHGATYMELTEVCVDLEDESGIKSVRFWCYDLTRDRGKSVVLSGPLYHGTWKASVSITQSGDYDFWFSFEDMAGNVAFYGNKVTERFDEHQDMGTFTIYADLQGKWYIDDVEITSPTQTVYSQDLTLNFKFVKTKGSSDVTCTASWDTRYETLPKTDNEWSKDITFPKAGTYYVTLKATDGKKTITLSLADLYVGTTPAPKVFTGLNWTKTLGFSLVVVGSLLLIPEIKERWK